jgi:cytochrome c oxidase subunit III
MSLFQQLMAKPWLATGAALEEPRDRDEAHRAAKRLALRVFLAVVAVLFMLLLIAYGGRMAYEDWRPAPQLGLLWANTFVLVLSSVALQWAQYSIRRGQMDAMRIGLLAAGAFTVVFLFGQLLAWRQLATMVYFEFTNPAIAFFYLITGLHGVHLLGGLVAWGRTVARVWGKFDVAKIRQSVELCTLYWHFLLGVWLVLFGLLFTGNNLDLLLKLCGIR